MDLPAALAGIAALSVEDRIRIVQAIWDTIAPEETHPEPTEAQKADLDRRIADLEAAPEVVLTWEQIEAHVRGMR